MSFRTTAGRVVVALVLLTPSAAFPEPFSRQDGAAAPAQEEVVVPQPIPEGQITASADVISADFRRIEAMLRPDPNVTRIEAALLEREAMIVTLFGRLDRIDPNRISARHLDDQRLPWLELRDELEDWAAFVTYRFDALQAEREHLRDERLRWRATSTSANAEEMAPELLRRIDSTLTRVGDVEARVRDRRNAVGAIADRIVGHQEQVDDAMQRLDELAELMRDRLFAREAPPLWRVLDTVDAPASAGELRQTGRRWLETLVTYVELRRARFVSLLVLFVLLAAGMRELRRKSLAWPEDDRTLGPARRLLARPYSLTLSVAVVVATVTLPFAVWAVTDVLFLLALVPMMRVGSVVLGPQARRALYGVATLTLLAHVAALGPDGSLTTRSLLLSTSALAFVGAVWMGIRGRRSAVDRTGPRRAGNAVSAVGAIFFGAAVGANVLGWVGLSGLMTQAALASVFAAFVWAIVVAAIATLLPPVFDGPVGRILPGLRRQQAVVSNVLVRTTALLAFLAWARSSLIRFQVWEGFRTYAAEVAAAGFSIGGLTLSTGGLLGAMAILAATWLVAGLVRFLLREEVLPRFEVRSGAAQSVVTLANYVVYGIGVVSAASAMGLSGTQLTVVIGALSVGIGFGLQNIVNNFVSGLILIFERPIKVGDVVQTVDHWGKIERIGIRASIIRSFDGAEIVVPNGDLISKEVVNWTRSDQIRRAEVLVGVAYGSDPRTVLELLLRVAREHPLTLEEPEPRAQMIDFGNSSVDFRVRCWTEMENWVQVASDLRVAIWDELAEAGITIPFPQRDLHLKSSFRDSENEDDEVVGELNP